MFGMAEQLKLCTSQSIKVKKKHLVQIAYQGI